MKKKGKELTPSLAYKMALSPELTMPTHKMRCPYCGHQIELNKDQILDEWDWSEATNVHVVSYRCPHCGKRIIISETGIDGKVVEHIHLETLTGGRRSK